MDIDARTIDFHAHGDGAVTLARRRSLHDHGAGHLSLAASRTEEARDGCELVPASSLTPVDPCCAGTWGSDIRLFSVGCEMGPITRD